MIDAKKLEKRIFESKNSLRAERLDMSFGELMNMYDEESLFITPEYQRAFRWSIEQQTKFIESILLGIPIPPIFVAENKKAQWELVDGLQRLSTIFSFFGILKNVSEEKNNLKLVESSVIKGLENHTINTFSPLSKFSIKKSVCRVEIINWDSNVNMRYELFSRLNTGGEPLTEQEIRNCIYRGYDNKLNQILIDIGANDNFINIIKPTKKKRETMFCEELILRFFTFKNHGLVLKTNIQDHLTDYMAKVSRKEISFNYKKEKENLIKIISFINNNFDYKIFRTSSGNFTPAIFDAIMLALDKYFYLYENNTEKFFEKVEKFKTSDAFKEASKKYSTNKIKNRIETAYEIFNV